MDLQKVLDQLLVVLKPMIKQLVEEKVLAPLEKQVKDSSGKIDDLVALPLIAEARRLLAAW